MWRSTTNTCFPYRQITCTFTYQNRQVTEGVLSNNKTHKKWQYIPGVQSSPSQHGGKHFPPRMEHNRIIFIIQVHFTQRNTATTDYNANHTKGKKHWKPTKSLLHRHTAEHHVKVFYTIPTHTRTHKCTRLLWIVKQMCNSPLSPLTCYDPR